MRLPSRCAAIALATAGAGLAQIHLDTGARQMLASPDTAFAMNVHQSGLARIQFGKLAEQKAAAPELRQLGAQIAEYYADLNEKLESIALRDRMVLARVVSAKDQGNYDKLQRLSGATFDKACAKEMLKAQEAAAKRFAHQAKRGKDERLREFASDALPALEQQVDKLKSLHS